MHFTLMETNEHYFETITANNFILENNTDMEHYFETITENNFILVITAPTRIACNSKLSLITYFSMNFLVI